MNGATAHRCGYHGRLVTAGQPALSHGSPVAGAATLLFLLSRLLCLWSQLAGSRLRSHSVLLLPQQRLLRGALLPPRCPAAVRH